MRTNVDGGGKLEATYGYSRAVKVGETIKVSGTCAVDADGQPFAPGDAAAQTVRCFEIIGAALQAAGAELGHVVINRIYLTNIEDAAAVGQAHGQIFGEVRPACTMMAVAALVNPDFLVEIECEAIVPAGETATTH